MERTEFFEHLYQNCAGLTEIRAIGTGGIIRQAFFQWDDHDGIDKYCNNFSGFNLYFGVATRDGNGGKKENLVNIPAVWCDVDYKDTPRDELRELYGKFPLMASIVVTTGGGVHFYWLLKEPIDQNELVQEIPRIEDVNRRIAQALGGDFASCDAPRILRIPDTTNHKYAHRPQVQITSLENFFYDLDDFEILSAVEKSPDKPVKKSSFNNDAVQTIKKCKFIQYCDEHQKGLPEPLWYAMLSNVASVRPGGASLCHELSRDYPKYSRKETDRKIIHAIDSSAPISCEEIRRRGFDCPKKCYVASPAGLIFEIEYGDPSNEGQNQRRISVSIG